MKVHVTKHFKERVKERFRTNFTDKEDYLVKLFKKIIKEKIKIEKRVDWVWVLRTREFKFIFSEPTWGECTLITFGMRWTNSDSYDEYMR